jgi:3-oxoacyl-[acyl-carrier protein] reductase
MAGLEVNMDVNGKVAIVTGGARGIGRACVEVLASAGATGVLIADIDRIGAQATAKETSEASGCRVVAVETDVSDEVQVANAIRIATEEFGFVDILVNNAGVFPVVPWDEVSLASWDRVLSINLTGMFLFCKAVIPIMKARQDGRIVFISSDAAFTGSAVAHVAYGVSKAGILALMMSVAKGFAEYNIRANAITPGPIDTPGAHDLGERFWVATENKTLLKRHGAPRELADAVLYLVSDRSSYITGQVIRVNGGWNLG